MNDDRPHVRLLDLIRDPSQVAQVSPDQIPAILAQLSAVQASMAARLAGASRETAGERGQDSLIGVEEAAKRLDVSKDWLYRRTSKLPFVVRVGRHVRFSSNGIDRFIRTRQRA